MTDAALQADNNTFLLKGTAYTLTTLQLLSVDYETMNQQLASKVEQAPKFFNNTPVVLDLQKIASLPVEIDFTKLLGMMRQHKLIPVGIRGGTPDQNGRALALGLAVMYDTRYNEQEKPAKEQEKLQPAKDPGTQTPSLLITQPVRSGQQIYARGGDLIITAPVSTGAEVIADGHIHIYAPLRGRALAGVNGDKNARIFCSSLEAELVSVAGQYSVNEDLRQAAWEQSVVVALENDELRITALS
jgi:septum site-determining protein MinC